MRICAFITLYKPDVEKLKINLREISVYAEKIYLLVNDKSFDMDFSDISESKDSIQMILNNKNIGLSSAFNIALKQAEKEGFDEAVLFDQDSFLSKDDFERMNREFTELKKEKLIMCIGPSLRVYGNILPTPKWTLSKELKTAEKVLSVKNIITSGMILDIDSALRIGGFEDSLPVDFCDFYFCYKAVFNGYYVLKSTDAFLTHEIGNASMKIGKSTVHFHAPYRNYFLVRDTLRTVFCFKETPFSIRFRYLAFLIPRMVLFLLKCGRKKERLRMYYLGLKDFFTKNYGFGSIAKLLNAE